LKFFEKAVEIASHLTLPVPVVAFAIVFSAFAYWMALRSKKRGVASLLLTVLICIILLGLAPLAASTYLESSGVYHIMLVVRGTDQRPVNEAQVTASIGATIKKGESYWEIDVPPQTRPPDHHIQVFASQGTRAGETTVVLENSFSLQAMIDLKSLPFSSIRGVVKDEHGAGVPDVHVSIPGYKDGTTTDQWGNFELPAHAAEGQMITLRAEKAGLNAQTTVPAGTEAELTLKQR